jgi:muramoyltetrapeptide carboxypeptidase LdcA involved in peptidoglycan recycling
MPIIPPKLTRGSHVRIIAPSGTVPRRKGMNGEFLDRATQFFLGRGMTVSEGKYIRERDAFDSTKVAHRIEDLHDAFRDPSVSMISALRGGWNANQLLRHIDFDLIRKNPKIFCGFSDNTALSNAIFAKTGLVTYSGPNFYHFGFGSQMGYTYESFEACLIIDEPYSIVASKKWTAEHFTPENPTLKFRKNTGWWIIHEGRAEGTSIGGNLCTFNLLQGTEYMPSLKGTILFLEDDHMSDPKTFDRDLQSLLHQPGSEGIRAVVIGRFQPQSKMTEGLLRQIIQSKPELKNIPVIANVDFGHTSPQVTFPIGGKIRIQLRQKKAEMVVVGH